MLLEEDLSRPKTKREIDSTDAYFLSLILTGKTSAYSIWTYIKKKAKEEEREGKEELLVRKVMAYNNVNKRITNLAYDGLLEEMNRTDDSSIHARKDFKLTAKGIECLFPHIIKYPDQISIIIKYMNEFGIDKGILRTFLNYKFIDALTFVDFFLRSIKVDPELKATYSTTGINHVQKVYREMEALMESEKMRTSVTREQKLFTRHTRDEVKSSEDLLTDHRPESEEVLGVHETKSRMKEKPIRHIKR